MKRNMKKKKKLGMGEQRDYMRAFNVVTVSLSYFKF